MLLLLSVVTVCYHQDATVAQLLERLKADSPEEREQALKSLVQQGVSALPALEGAIVHLVDRVQRQYAQRALFKIKADARLEEMRNCLSADLQKECPEILSLAHSNDEDEWMRLIERLTGFILTSPHSGSKVKDDLPLFSPSFRAIASSTRKDVSVLAKIYTDGDWRSQRVSRLLGHVIQGCGLVIPRSITNKLGVSAASLPEVTNTIERADNSDALSKVEQWAIGDIELDLAKKAVSKDRPQAIAALSALLQHKSPRVRRDSVRRLTALHYDGASETIRQVLRDSDIHVRIAAAEMLGCLGMDDAEKELTITVNNLDEPETVRYAALVALAKFAHPESIPVFREAMRASSWWWRATAIDGLVRCRSRELVPQIRELLGDANPSVVSRTVEALALLNDEVSLPAIRAMMKQPPQLNEALRALGLMSDSVSVELIRRRLDDVNPLIRQTALTALLRCGSFRREVVVEYVKEGSEVGLADIMWELNAFKCARASMVVRNAVLRYRKYSGSISSILSNWNDEIGLTVDVSSCGIDSQEYRVLWLGPERKLSEALEVLFPRPKYGISIQRSSRIRILRASELRSGLLNCLETAW